MIAQRATLNGTTAVTTLIVAGLVGVIAVQRLEYAAAAVVALILAGLTLTGIRFSSIFLHATMILLGAYFFFGRGIAHFAVGPAYIGEAVMCLALFQLMTTFWKMRLGLVHFLLLGFMLLGLMRTLPFIGPYGKDALRDAVVWGYAVYALALCFTLERRHFDWILAAMRRWLLWIVLLGYVSIAIQYSVGSTLPYAPGSDLPLLSVRPADTGVHFAALLAFLLLGLYGRDGNKRNETLVFLLCGIGLLFFASQTRGAFVATAVALVAVFYFRPTWRWVQMIGLTAGVAALLLVLNLNIKVGYRNISVSEAFSTVTSIVSPPKGTALEGTVDFRERWWSTIYDYTVKGPYFWQGKGFGINLADADGFQILDDHSLRAPHNSHLTILARMGVPGLAIWAAFSAAFGIGLLDARRRFNKAGDTTYGTLAVWILIYWLASMVNAATQVYLETPNSAIWFWCIVGAGMALMAVAQSESTASLQIPEPERTPLYDVASAEAPAPL